ncbi:hypothetical protein D6745_02140 [Candidatus Woesearchaeota archaeon]|nr:MAG: hypothetical protein D6745_02140 [Candidatus Woesearchaeota archaeon]
MVKERISISIDKEVLERLDREVVNSRSELIEKIITNFVMNKKSAVILAGGPPQNLLTKKGIYRPLIRIKDKTLIEDIISKLRNSGFEQIFIIGSKKILAAIFQVIGETGIVYVEETKHLGTAKTLSLLRSKLRNTFLFVPCDHYFELDLRAIEKYHLENKGIVTLVVYSGVEHEWKKSSIVKLEGNRITEYVESPKYVKTHLTSILIGFAEPTVFGYIPKSDINYSLQKDLFVQLAKEGKLIGYIFSGKWKNVHSEDDAKEI